MWVQTGGVLSLREIVAFASCARANMCDLCLAGLRFHVPLSGGGVQGLHTRLCLAFLSGMLCVRSADSGERNAARILLDKRVRQRRLVCGTLLQVYTSSTR